MLITYLPTYLRAGLLTCSLAYLPAYPPTLPRQVKAALEEQKVELVRSSAAAKRHLDEEREERIAATEDVELLVRELEAAAQEAELRTVVDSLIVQVPGCRKWEVRGGRYEVGGTI